MASLIAISPGGNFTAAGTWGVVNTTSELDAENSTTSIGVGNSDSVTWTGTAATVDGVALKMASRVVSPVGTLTVILRNSTDSVDERTVTVNVSDLPPLDAAANSPNWVFFKFGSNFTFNAGKNYLIRLTASNASQVAFYRNATANNHARKLRTTTTGAPAAGDQLVTSAELTGAGTENAVTITMDNTATTSFGPTVSGGPPQGIMVSTRSVWNWGTAASTNYYLRHKGILGISGNAVFNMGTSGTPIPSTSTAIVEADSAVNVDSGVENYSGTWRMHCGGTKTVTTELTADAAIAATVLTLGSTTGWEASDVIALAPTGTAVTQHEKRTILTVDSGTQVTVTAGLTNAHSGVSPTRAEVINLTRRVKVRGISASLRGYIRLWSTSINEWRYVEFTNLGSGTSNKRGIDAQTTTGSFDIRGSAIHTIPNNCFGILGGTSCNNFTIRENCAYDIGQQVLQIPTTGGATMDIQDNCWMFQFDATAMVILNNAITSASIFKNNKLIAHTNNNNLLSIGTTTSCIFTEANWSGNVLHHSGGSIIDLGAGTTIKPVSGTWASWKYYFGTNNGLVLTGVAMLGLTLKNGEFFGGGTSAARGVIITLAGNDSYGNLTLDNCTITGFTSQTNNNVGINFAGNGYVNLTIDNTVVGLNSSPKTLFTTADLNFGNTATVISAVGRDTTFNSTNKIVGLQDGTGSSALSYVDISKWAQTNGDHRSFYRYGTISIDTSIFRSGAPSARVTPNNASEKILGPPFSTPISSGATRTFSVWVRKSALGDGAAYNGTQPQLVLLPNPAIGIDSESVLDTMTVGTGTWEELTGTTPSAGDNGVVTVVVRCDGTAGWINIDDPSRS